MAQTINTNLASLNAQRNLNTSQAALNTSLQRLSSGLRINSAKDDSAGLAISERMTAQIRGLDQAARNSNDAISLSQTAEGNLAEIGNVLQRMREIAVQSVSDSNTPADRASLQAEVASLSSEVDRIASSAQFNGRNLLDGTFGTATFQVGANANQSIAFAITSAKAATLGLGGAATAVGAITSATAYTLSGAMTMGGATIAQATNDGVSYVNGAQAGTTSALASANTINLSTATTDITATAKTVVTSAALTGTQTAIADGGFKVNGTSVGVITLASTVADRVNQMVLAVNAVSGTTGVTATAVSGTKYELTAADGRNIDITSTAAGLITDYAGFIASTAAGVTNYGQVTLTSGKAFTVGGTVAGGIVAGTYALIGSTVDVSTSPNSTAAIQSLDAAITKVNSQRATLGTMQSRFDSVISNLNSSSENLGAARGRIRDADFAKETASLTRNQILQQAGVAMLAQANSLPSNVLALLK